MSFKKTITLFSAAVLLAIGAQAQTTTDTNKTIEYIPSPRDRVPEFPGGMDKVPRYLAKNIRYPAAAREANIQGRVLVRFIVGEDGTISEAKALTHLGGGLEEEAVRVVNKMPKWTPAMQQGKPVKVYFTMPISFWLE